MESASQKKPTQQQWLRLKPTIRRLYITEDMALNMLPGELRPLGMVVSESQLAHQLKKWGMVKNIDDKTWRYIGHTITDRQKQGKNSEVIHCGKRVKPSAISKGVSRHFINMKMLDRLKYKHCPPSPPPVNLPLAVCTPPPLPMEFYWPSTLPWFQFNRTFFDIPGPFKHLESNNLQISGTVSHLAICDSLIPLNRYATSGSPQDASLVPVSRLAAHIGLMMPEAYPGEHLQNTQLILSNAGSESLLELFKIQIYRLSNDLTKDMDSVELEALYDLLYNAGFLSASIDFEEMRNQSVTFKAFTDSLLRIALTEVYKSIRFPGRVMSDKIEALIKRLLPSCRDFRIVSPESYKPVTALQFAVESYSLELIGLCLTVDPVLNSDLSTGAGERIFYLAGSTRTTVVKIQRLITALLQTGAFINLEWLLLAAIKIKDHDLIRETIKCGADPSEKLAHGSVYKDALAVAASVDKEMLLLILDFISIQNPSKSPTVSVTPEAFVSAARNGDVDIISTLHYISPIGFRHNEAGFTPIDFAVFHEKQPTVELLFQLYGFSQPVPVLRAIETGNLGILRFLIETGVDLKSLDFFRHLPDDYDQRRVALGIMIESGAPLPVEAVNELSKQLDVGSLEVVLNAGGDPNRCDKSGDSPLASAMSKRSQCGDRALVVELLLNRGARLQGNEVLKALQDRDRDLLIILQKHGAVLDPLDDSEAVFEAVIFFRDPYFLNFVIESLPGHYSPMALCAAVAVGNSDLIDHFLANRPQNSESTLMEGTAVGLAARRGDITLLKKLLLELRNPSMALLPSGLTSYRRFDDCHGWHLETEQGSPLALSISCFGTDGLSELLKDGYTVDTHTWELTRDSPEHLRILEEHCQLPPPQIRVLMLAISNEDEQLMKALLKAGVEVNVRGLMSGGCSPLQKAVRCGNLSILNCLLQAGADINLQACFFGGMTALQYAASEGYMGLAKHLLELGARVNARGSRIYGLTALETAAENGRLDMLQLLLSNGAIITGAGREQFVRAVYYAEYVGHNAAAQFLRQSREWTEGDQRLFQELFNSEDPNEAFPTPCCDEVHGSGDECIYDYTEEEEEAFHLKCPWHKGISRF
ncbi:hypothetical protein ACHAPU_002363 [Fusarium lateritium]